MKTCTICHKPKSLDEYIKRSSKGYYTYCKQCTSDKAIEKRRTKLGLIEKIYYDQAKSSKSRNHPPPNYTKSQLTEFALSNPLFHKLHKEWVESNYQKDKIPSFDRINNNKPYRLSNLQIMTWKENTQKFQTETKNGKNKKLVKPVKQYTIKGKFIAKYHSLSEATRKTGVLQGGISNCCIGRKPTAGGFKWKYT